MGVFENIDKLSPREEYNMLLNSGMFYEFYPELTGIWVKDTAEWLEIKGIIRDDMSIVEKLKLVHAHQTEEEIQVMWDDIKEVTKDIKCDWLDSGITVEDMNNAVDNVIEQLPSIPQIIYEALYNCNIYEPSYATISLHKTLSGAKAAIENHKQKIKAEFDDWYNPSKDIFHSEYYDGLKWDDNQAWTINKTQLLD